MSRNRRYTLLGLVLFTGAMLTGCTSAAPLTTLAGGGSGWIEFQSISLPETQLLSLTKEGKPTVIGGELRLPQGSPARVPAVVIIPRAGEGRSMSSGGVTS